jgi:hypothetical protein
LPDWCANEQSWDVASALGGAAPAAKSGGKPAARAA